MSGGDDEGGASWFSLFKWFLLIIVGLWVLWYYTGGPERAEQQGAKPFLKALEPLDSGEPYGVRPR